jgi:hypothetical protein
LPFGVHLIDRASRLIERRSTRIDVGQQVAQEAFVEGNVRIPVGY